VQARFNQDEDGIWIAEIPAIPGSASDDKTHVEALKNVRDAAELCIAVREDLDMPLGVNTASVEMLL